MRFTTNDIFTRKNMGVLKTKTSKDKTPPKTLRPLRP